jgi:uncharacterized membrane protein YqiK
MNFFMNYLSYFVVGFVVLLMGLAYKPLMRLFGIVVIPDDKIGLVNKVFRLWGGALQIENGIVAIKGEAGMQAPYLSSGVHFWLWPWKYKISEIGFFKVDQHQVGLIEAIDGKPLPEGSILATYVECENFQDATAFLEGGGFKGKQTKILPAGTYKINTFLFIAKAVDAEIIEQNKIGVVTTLAGKPLPASEIASSEMTFSHESFQNADIFLKNGGFKGLQSQVIQSGMYYLNPWFVRVQKFDMTVIPIGHVGVVISYVGEEGKDLTGDGFKHGNIVTRGQKGVWNEPLDPGKYPINPLTTKVEIVPTTNLVLNWATGKNESHELDKNLSTITVRSKDGFTFNLDISQIIHVPSKEASKVIARFGNMLNLISQVLEPTIGNYFRNSAQDSDVIQFLGERRERQTEAKGHISKVLNEYNVTAVDTLIGDIVPPKELMATLTDRKIAQEQKTTFITQKDAQATRQEFEKAKAVADMQERLVEADQNVVISQNVASQKVKEAEGTKQSKILQAEGEAQAIERTATATAKKITQEGNAKAEVTLSIGKATAEAYQLTVDAMGADNFAKLKVIEAISSGNIKITPDVIVGGGQNGGGSAIDALLGLEVAKYVGKSITVDTPKTDVTKADDAKPSKKESK